MKNLVAEMKRYGISNSDIQSLLGCAEKTVRNKLSEETEFTVSEAFKIRDAYFPAIRPEYLFASDQPRDVRDASAQNSA